MLNNPTRIRIVAADAPRETIKTLLSRCRNGRKGSIQLTGASADGYYYAVIENEAIADTFRAVLTELVIGHSEVEVVPNLRVVPTQPQPTTTSTVAGERQRCWTGDSRVDRAISDYFVKLFTPGSDRDLLQL